MKMSPSKAPAITRTCFGLPTLEQRQESKCFYKELRCAQGFFVWTLCVSLCPNQNFLNGWVWCYQVQTDPDLLWANLRNQRWRGQIVLNWLDINQLSLAIFSLIIQDSPVSTVPGMNMARLSNCLRCWIHICCLDLRQTSQIRHLCPIFHHPIQNILLRTQTYSLKPHHTENKSHSLFRVPVSAVFILAKLSENLQSLAGIKTTYHTPKKYRGLHTSYPKFYFIQVLFLMYAD